MTSDDQRLCPITGQPLPAADMRAVISRDAAERFKYKLNNLADKFQAARTALNPSREPHEGSRPQPGSRPPLNLHALSILTDAEHIIYLWATDILTNQHLGTHITQGDWHTTQHVLQNADLVHYYPAPDMIEEISTQIRRLDSLKEKPAPDQGITELERLAKLDQLKRSWFTSAVTIETIKLYAGHDLPKQTLNQWGNDGKVRHFGNPRRYSIEDTLNMLDTTTDSPVIG
jgi:hypothetical protein